MDGTEHQSSKDSTTEKARLTEQCAKQMANNRLITESLTGSNTFMTEKLAAFNPATMSGLGNRSLVELTLEKKGLDPALNLECKSLGATAAEVNLDSKTKTQESGAKTSDLLASLHGAKVGACSIDEAKAANADKAAGADKALSTNLDNGNSKTLLEQLKDAPAVLRDNDNKLGACSLTEARANGTSPLLSSIEAIHNSDKPSTVASMNSDNGNSKTLLEQLKDAPAVLRDNDHKSGACSLTEARANGSLPLLPSSEAFHSLDKPSTASSSPLIEQLKSNDTKAGACSIEEAKANGTFAIGPLSDVKSSSATVDKADKANLNLIDQLKSNPVKPGACSIEEAKANGSLPLAPLAPISDTGRISASSAGDNSANSSSSSLLDQLKTVKVGACNVDEAKANGSWPLSAHTDNAARATSSDSGTTSPAASTDSQASGGNNTPSLLDRLQTNYVKVGACSLDEAKANGSLPISDAPKAAQFDTVKATPADAPVSAPAPSLIDSLKGVKVGACSTDEAKTNGTYPLSIDRSSANQQASSRAQDAPAPTANASADFKQAVDTSRPTFSQQSIPVDGGQKTQATSIFDSLKSYDGKAGACNVDEAKANGTYNGGQLRADKPSVGDTAGNAQQNASTRNNSDAAATAQRTAADPTAAPKLVADTSARSTDYLAKSTIADGAGKQDSQSARADSNFAKGDITTRDTVSTNRTEFAGTKSDTTGVRTTDAAPVSGIATRASDVPHTGTEATHDSTVRSAADLSRQSATERINTVSESSRVAFALVEPARAAFTPDTTSSRTHAANELPAELAKQVALVNQVAAVAAAPTAFAAAAAAISAQALIPAGLGRIESSLATMARLSLPGDIESVQLAKAISLVSLPGVGATVQDRSAVLLPGAVPIMSASILPLSAIQAQADRSGVINPASSMQIADRTVAGSVLVNGVNQSTDRAAATATQSGIIPAVDGQRIASQTLTAAGDRTATVQSTLPGDASVKIASSVVDTGRRDTTVSNLVEATKGSAVVLDNGLRAEGGSKAIETGKIFADKSEAILVDGKNVGGKVVINGGIDPVTGIVRFAGISGVEAAAAAAGRRAELTGFELELDEHGIPIKRSNDKLYFTGVEVAIAAILTVSGAARLRNEKQNAAADSIGASDAAVEFDANGNEINAQKVLHRRTHLVSHGDTLLSIADDLYQNQAVAWLIADLNTHNVKEERIDGKRVIELKSRQLLELPEAEEVTQFLAQLRRDFDAEQLITVVSESTVDRELINTFLGTVTGSTAEQSQISISLAAPMPAPVLAKTVTEKAAPMRLTDALPDLVIDMDFDDRFPVAVGISTAIKSLTHRVGKMIRRPIPTNKLRTV